MVTNYLSAAMRNFMRNRVYSTIVTLSLATGFAAMMLALIYWRYEHSYDQFWPDSDRIYLVASKTEGLNGAGGPAVWGSPPSSVGPVIARAVPRVEAVSRLRLNLMNVAAGRMRAKAKVATADSNFFDLFAPTLVAGDLRSALRPGSAVITRSVAEQYFGRANAVGESLRLEPLGASTTPRHAQVSAVIEDWPTSTHLDMGILVGGDEAGNAESAFRAATYLKMRKGVAEADLRRALDGLSGQLPPAQTRQGVQVLRTLLPISLHDAYMPPKAHGASIHAGKSGQPGLPRTFLALGVLMVVVSSINFVNLMTARAAGRALEVGVRKAAGARRLDLIIQFVGEGLLYSGIALVIALGLVEIVRPVLASVTGQTLPLHYSLGLLGTFVLGAAVIGATASLYPAFILSATSPISAMRGGIVAISGSPRLRQLLVVLQFIPLLVLAGGALAFQGHERTVLANSMKMIPRDGLLLREPCTVALKNQLTSISGVSSVSCLEMEGFRGSPGYAGIFQPIGTSASKRIPGSEGAGRILDVRYTDRDALEYYDADIIAGRLWTGAADARGVVLNQDAAERLGADPNAVIGRQVTIRDDATRQSAMHPVIGVIRNRGGTTNPGAVAYLAAPPMVERTGLVTGVRFSEDADLVSTTAAIDKVFRAAGGRLPRRSFYRDEVLEGRSQERQILQWLTIVVSVGLVMAAAGMFAMAVFLANLRTKEIGVRKAFGASRYDLLRILVFQFAKPVLIANLAAIPMVAAISTLVVKGVPVDQRLTLALGPIAAILLGSLMITGIVTFSQAWRVTGHLPLRALRSE